MTKALDLDLKKLQARAFDRAEWAEGVLRRYHSAIQKLDGVVVQQLQGLYKWMFVPPTLWPFNVQDVLADCLAALEKGKHLNPRHRLIINLLPEPLRPHVLAIATALHWFGYDQHRAVQRIYSRLQGPQKLTPEFFGVFCAYPLRRRSRAGCETS